MLSFVKYILCIIYMRNIHFLDRSNVLAMNGRSTSQQLSTFEVISILQKGSNII
jgi:hypothetical protein